MLRNIDKQVETLRMLLEMLDGISIGDVMLVINNTRLGVFQDGSRT